MGDVNGKIKKPLRPMLLDGSRHRLKLPTNRNDTKERPMFQNACLSCGGNHPSSACKFKNTDCLHCGRKGHLARVCRASQPTVMPSVRTPFVRKTPFKTTNRRKDCFTITKGRYPAESVIGQANSNRKKKESSLLK